MQQWEIWIPHPYVQSTEDRFPIFIHTHTPFHRERKRCLAIARNDTRKGITPHRLSYSSLRMQLLPDAFPPCCEGLAPLRGTLSCAFGAALLKGPARWGLSHIGFHTVVTLSAPAGHLPLEGNAVKLSKILIAHASNSVCFFHPLSLLVNNKIKKLVK